MEIRINNGIIRGMREHGCISFKGIPYAKSPTGKRRFMPPGPSEDWFGALDCTYYGPRPIQTPPPWCLDKDSAVYSEDCLNINIWTPNTDEKKRPVLFNIFGGGHMEGSNSELGSEGYRLLKSRDIVVVSPNYRVGALGYLYLGHLLGKDYATSGNLGLLDLVLALKWVQQNISFFGGDPNRVTLVGQSAGGKSVMSLLLAPEAKGLFHGAVAMSGALQGIKNIHTEKKLTKNFLTALSLLEEDTSTLLTMSSQDIATAQEKANEIYFKAESYGPTADGIILPLDIENAIKTGNVTKVPVLMGHTVQELFLPPDADRTDIGITAVEKKLQWKFGDNAPRVLEYYKELRLKYDYATAYGITITNYTYVQPYLRTASLLTEQRFPLWLYRWDYTGDYIAGHSSDNEALYGRTLAQKLIVDPDMTKRLDHQFREAILNFVESGNPNGNSLPEWTPYDNNNPYRMIYDKECHLSPLDLNYDISFPLQVYQ